MRNIIENSNFRYTALQSAKKVGENTKQRHKDTKPYSNAMLQLSAYEEKQTDVIVEIYNLTGINIKSYTFENASNTLQIVTSDLAQGLYVIKVNANSNNFYKSVKVQVIK